MKYPLVLASASPRRKNLLARLRTPFRVIPSHIPEKRKKGESPSQMVRRLAVQKAKAVLPKLGSQPSLIIGSDTVVVIGGEVLGKPRSSRHAARMLIKLSGKTHRVYTGVAVVNSRTLRFASVVDVTRVKFKLITPAEARKIGRKHLDKAGSYAFQDRNDKLVRKIVGNWQTVVGLPLRPLKKLLDRFHSRYRH